MRYLRAAARALAFVGLMGGVSALLIPGMALLSASEKKARWWRNFIFRNWAKATAALLGMKITVHGSPPKPPFLLVSNHLSYIDVIVFASRLDCVFVAKQDVSDWPFIGRLCREVKTIFIDRENRRDLARVNGLIERALAEGEGVVLFPEGTSTSGATVLPFKPSLLEYADRSESSVASSSSTFKPSLLEYAARARYPVSYAAVSYRTPPDQPPAHTAVCWWGEMTFIPHLFGLFQLTGFEATVVFGPQQVQAEDRKVLAGELWGAVKEQFVPVATVE